ncbi:MAG: helix-turn-helix domain-containing protein [Myxococcales bacterium]|nr:helix-turn-helix domain-containing protein [Myxococcales bacterium]
MQTSIEIRLSPQEDRELRLRVRRQTAPYREVVQAKIILMLAHGESFSEVSRTAGVARRIVYKWANRFLGRRLDGLRDLPRSGRPARSSPDRRYASGEAGLRATG